MTDKNLVVLTIIISSILYPFYIIIMRKFRVKSNNNSKAVKAMREGKSVTAKLGYEIYVPGNPLPTNEVGEREAHPDTWLICYDYIVDGKTYSQKYTNYEIGAPKEITMYYFPNNPKKAYSENFAKYSSTKKIGCVTIFILPAILFVLLFHILRFILLGIL